MRAGLSLAVAGLAYGAEVSPIEKVIEMLNSMITKGDEEKAAEAALCEKIADDSTQKLNELRLEIEHLQEVVEKKDAESASNNADADKLDEEIAGLKDDNQANAAALKKRSDERAGEKAIFLKEEKDAAESVDALTRAIGVLKSQSKRVDASFVQELSQTVPAAKKDLEAFLEQPQASQTAYESGTGKLIDMLKGLKDDFSKQLNDLRTGEANAENAFNMYRIDMESEISGVDKAISDKTTQSGSHRAKAGAAAKARDQAQDSLDEDLKTKKDTEVYMSVQAKSCAANQKMRTEELAALGEAVEIMGGEAVSTGAENHKRLAATSFLQLKTTQIDTHKQELIKRVASLIQQRNMDQLDNKSAALSMLSIKMMTGGPFDKVIGMIEKLIKTLTDEMNAAAEHHAWCQEEIKKTTETRDKHQAEVDRLLAELESLEATKAQLLEHEKELNNKIATLQKDMGKATEERNEQKAENTRVIEESTQAEAAVAKAIEVLEGFYSKTALLQQEQGQPVVEAYGGQGGSSKGVIGLMETIQADFSRLIADTSAAEATQSATFSTYMKDSKQTVVDSKQEASDTRIEVTKTKGKIGFAKKDLNGESTQLKAAQDYYAELMPMCTVKKQTYEERKAEREAEIAALKEAYKILSEEA